MYLLDPLRENTVNPIIKIIIITASDTSKTSSIVDNNNNFGQLLTLKRVTLFTSFTDIDC